MSTASSADVPYETDESGAPAPTGWSSAVRAAAFGAGAAALIGVASAFGSSVTDLVALTSEVDPLWMGGGGNNSTCCVEHVAPR